MKFSKELAARKLEEITLEVENEKQDFRARHGIEPNALMMGSNLAETLIAAVVGCEMTDILALDPEIGQKTFNGLPIILTRPTDRLCGCLLNRLDFLKYADGGL